MNFKRKILILLIVLSMLLPQSMVFASDLGEETLKDTITDLDVTRMAGANRYLTSINVSKSLFKKSEYAVIASGEVFPDALVGGVLAQSLDAPLLVAQRDRLSTHLIDELKRLEVKTVYLLGGTNTLSEKIENELKDYNINRLAGNNRYETAKIIEKEIRNIKECKDFYFADGRNFPDALAAAPYISSVNGTLSLNDGSELFNGIAIGGENSVPGSVNRISGKNRYETAVKIAEKYENLEGLIIVDGTNYPDALSASSYASKNNMAILLSMPNILPDVTKDFIQKSGIKKIIIIGGENSVSKEIETNIKEEKPVEPEKPIKPEEPVNEYGDYKVTRVVDGDTIEVDFNGKIEKVRIIGIDTPESVHPDKSKNTECGKIASEFTKSKLENQFVGLEFDIQQRDRYGRMLAYVWLGDEMFNKTLLEMGMAQVATFPPNIKYVNDFIELEKMARENGIGFWGEIKCNMNSNTNNDLKPDSDSKPSTGYDPTSPKDGLKISPYPDRQIKGNISSSGEKIYHLPGQRDYDKTVIDESKGERWFQTEAEAVSAGWRKAKR